MIPASLVNHLEVTTVVANQPLVWFHPFLKCILKPIRRKTKLLLIQHEVLLL